jgi:putative ABC transport system permease protein
MFKNYFTTIRRNIARNISHTFINVAGLSLGIACSLMLYLIINHFHSFDRYHQRADHIYRIVSKSVNQGKASYGAGVPGAFPEAFRTDFSDIENKLFISAIPNALISIDKTNGEEEHFEEHQGLAYAESSYFDFFNRSWLAGNREDWNDDPNIVVISEKMAKKYFAETEVLGKSIRLNKQTDLKIVGVINDAPQNTDFPFNILISYENIKLIKMEQGWNSIYSDDQYYVMLGDGQHVEHVDKRFKDFIVKHLGAEQAENVDQWLQPLKDIRFDTRFGNFNHYTVPIEILWTLGVVAVFLILTACINFINLSTAVAVKRSREVGVRKVMGSTRMQLVFQFVGETSMISLLSVILALGIAEVGLTLLNPYTGLGLKLDIFQNLNLLTTVILLWITVSLLSGLYPALLMSAYNPVRALKNQVSDGADSKFNLRKALVVFQFVISQVFIIGVIVLIAQTRFFYNKDLGFDKEAIVSVPIPLVKDNERKKTLRYELSKLAGAQQVALGYTNPSSGSVSITSFRIEEDEQEYLTHIKPADGNYIETYGLRLIAGVGLQDADSITRFVVNEKFARELGFENPADIIGKMISYDRAEAPVTGVVQDFHTMSLRNEIDPVMLYNRINFYRTAAVKIHSGRINETLAEIEKIWKALYPDYTFQYRFMEQELENFYQQEKKMLGIFLVFTGMAIFIGCLGLYGLVSYMANRKVKEIGIRKVLGASVANIMMQFSREFFFLIIIGFVIAAPISWYVMDKWLNDFAYRIELGFPIFAIGLITTLIIALLTVGYRSLKAAFTNPSHALKTE